MRNPNLLREFLWQRHFLLLYTTSRNLAIFWNFCSWSITFRQLEIKPRAITADHWQKFWTCNFRAYIRVKERICMGNSHTSAGCQSHLKPIKSWVAMSKFTVRFNDADDLSKYVSMNHMQLIHEKQSSFSFSQLFNNLLRLFRPLTTKSNHVIYRHSQPHQHYPGTFTIRCEPTCLPIL